eukprot:TRINITY_DN88550_c0_g1_i1.p1 TRINITY_DN88550_c0_g1~~TRINITY_DN88550_c0_g1_i1.p1  ORF type:complete len:609 (-),score=80.78 TRINITY_DN88550_c0_g1_i1:194-2020(-)
MRIVLGDEEGLGVDSDVQLMEIHPSGNPAVDSIKRYMDAALKSQSDDLIRRFADLVLSGQDMSGWQQEVDKRIEDSSDANLKAQSISKVARVAAKDVNRISFDNDTENSAEFDNSEDNMRETKERSLAQPPTWQRNLSAGSQESAAVSNASHEPIVKTPPPKNRPSTVSEIDEDTRLRLQAESRATQFEMESVEELDPGRKCTVSAIVGSWYFEVAFALIILSNSIMIGVQVDYAATSATDETPPAFFVLSNIYAVLFLVELIMRMFAEGRSFFIGSPNLAWNYLDIIIVFSSIFETSVNIAMLSVDNDNANTQDLATSSNIRIIRIVRITRLARVLRIIKVIRFIRALRTLVHSILVTLKSLAWALVLLTLIIYVFGILFTDAVTSYLSEVDKSQNPELVASLSRFRSLHISMHTLFRCVSDGLDWDIVAAPLTEISWFWGYAFSGYIAFSCFAVLNVMTGVFCQSAQESAQRDHDLLVQSMLMDRQRNLAMLQSIFQTIERNGHGFITLLEFEQRFEDDAVRAFFQSLDLEPQDAWTLFKLLDTEGTGDVDAAEFVEGCMRLKGPAKSIDIAGLMHECKLIQRRIKDMDKRFKAMEKNDKFKSNRS